MLQIAGWQLEDLNLTAFGKNAYHTYQFLNPLLICAVCQGNSMAIIQRAGFLPEEENLKVYKTAQDHIERAHTEREYYNNQVSAAQSAWLASENGNSLATLGHCSFPTSPLSLQSSTSGS